jgi:hypothetical protein
MQHAQRTYAQKHFEAGKAQRGKEDASWDLPDWDTEVRS